MRADAVLQTHLGFHLLIRRRLQHRLVDHGDVPSGQVGRRHRELAGGEHPARALLRRRPRRAERVAEVAGRIALRKLVLVGVGDALHAERREDALPEERPERHPGRLLGDEAGDDEVGVAVLPLRAWLEVERPLGPALDDPLRRNRLQHERRHVVLRPEVLVAGGVREDLADRDLVAARQPGHVLADRIVDRQFALFLQEQQGGRGELLADRSDAVSHLGRRGQRRIQPRVSVGVRVGQAAIDDDRDRGARHACRREHRLRDPIHLGGQRPRPAAPCGPWERDAARGDEQRGQQGAPEGGEGCHGGDVT